MTVDELIPLIRAVTRSVKRALVVADLPFGSYQALARAGLRHRGPLHEGGRRARASSSRAAREMAPQIELLSRGGVPVMAHIGFTPQSEHASAATACRGAARRRSGSSRTRRAVEAAGAFAVVMEMVPGDVAAQVTKELTIPTIGIGAGVDCDAQVLVWQDAFGLRGPAGWPRFVKQYADLHGVLLEAARAYADEVRSGAFPGPDHTF